MPDPIPPIDAKAYPALVGELAKQVSAVVVGDADRNFYASQISEADARDYGSQIQSTNVLDGALDVMRSLLGAIVAGKVSGYGPLRFRYLVDLCAGLAERVATLDGKIVGAAGAGATKMTNLRGSRVNRRKVLRVLKNLAGRDQTARTRLGQAAKDQERPDERSRSLERLAQELEAAVARVPAAVATDAGATPELIKELRMYATGVLGAAGSAQGARADVAAMYDQMNVLDGRIMHEIGYLAASGRDARRSDPAVPAARNPFRRHKKAQTEAPPAPPLPVPA